MANAGQNASARRRSHPARDWLGDPYRDRAHWYFLVCLIVTATLLFVAERNDRPSGSTDEAPGAGSLARGLVEYENRTGGYRFIYPQTWDLRNDGRFTQVTSPDGTIDLSFQPRPNGTQGLSASPLLRPSDPEHSHERLIGSRWELIGGSLSLLVGGTATDTSGRRVRFLQISVGAEPRDYSITIVVPFKSDPEEVLPLVEEIVSTFDTIE